MERALRRTAPGMRWQGTVRPWSGPTEMRWRSFEAAKVKPKSRQKFFGGGVAYRTPLRIRPHLPTLLPFIRSSPARVSRIAWPALLYIAVLVETDDHKSGDGVFHSGGCCGLNLLEPSHFILRLLSDVMRSTLERLRSGCGVAATGWSG